MAKLPLPVGSEVSSGEGQTKAFLNFPTAGTYQQGHDKVQGKGEEVLATCHVLIIGSLRQTSLPTADQR